MKMRKKASTLFSFFLMLLFIMAVSCETGGSNRESIENDGYEMIEGEDEAPVEETLDSAAISRMKQLRIEGIRYKKLLDSIAEVNPKISYTYTPSEDGPIKTVLGNYKVEVDGTKTPEEEYSVAVLLQKNFQNRQEMLSFYNRLYNVDLPAAPKGGYAAFYEELKENLDYPQEVSREKVEGLLFVQLAIEKTGKISNIKISESLNTEEDIKRAIERSAIEAIKETSTTWNAAQKDGQPVRSKLEIPIWFDGNIEQS
jgi:hypothetical protein